MDEFASALGYIRNAPDEYYFEHFQRNPDNMYQILRRLEALTGRSTQAPSPPQSELEFSREDCIDGLETTESVDSETLSVDDDFELPRTLEDYLTTTKYGEHVLSLLSNLQQEKTLQFLSKPVRDAVGQPPHEKDFRFIDKRASERRKKGPQVTFRGILSDRSFALEFDKWQKELGIQPTRIEAITANRAASREKASRKKSYGKDRIGSALSFIRDRYPAEAESGDEALGERMVRDGVRRRVLERLLEDQYGVEMRGMSIVLMYLPRFSKIPFEDFDELISVLTKHVGIVRLAKRMSLRLENGQDYYDSGYDSGSHSDTESGDNSDDPDNLRFLLLSESPNLSTSVKQSEKRKRSDKSRLPRSRKKRTDIGQTSSLKATTPFSPTQSTQPGASSAGEEAFGQELDNRQFGQPLPESQLPEYNVSMQGEPYPAHSRNNTDYIHLSPTASFTGNVGNRDLMQERLNLLLTAAQQASQDSDQLDFHSLQNQPSASNLSEEEVYNNTIPLPQTSFNDTARLGFDFHLPLGLSDLNRFQPHEQDAHGFGFHPPLGLSDLHRLDHSHHEPDALNNQALGHLMAHAPFASQYPSLQNVVNGGNFAMR